jgi:hypothetical protein
MAASELEYQTRSLHLLVIEMPYYKNQFEL